MAFERINTAALIKNKCEENSELKKAWEESRNEYKIYQRLGNKNILHKKNWES